MSLQFMFICGSHSLSGLVQHAQQGGFKQCKFSVGKLHSSEIGFYIPSCSSLASKDWTDMNSKSRNGT